MRQPAKAYNLTICYRKKQINVSISYCNTQFLHNAEILLKESSPCQICKFSCILNLKKIRRKKEKNEKTNKQIDQTNKEQAHPC